MEIITTVVWRWLRPRGELKQVFQERRVYTGRTGTYIKYNGRKIFTKQQVLTVHRGRQKQAHVIEKDLSKMEKEELASFLTATFVGEALPIRVTTEIPVEKLRVIGETAGLKELTLLAFSKTPVLCEVRLFVDTETGRVVVEGGLGR